MSVKKLSIRDAVKMAEKAQKAGDLIEAANQYAAILTRFPNHPNAGKRLKKLHKTMTGSASLTQNDVNNLVAILQSGDMRSAERTATRLICIAPKEAVLHNFLGIALSRLSEQERAEKAFRTAIRIRLDYVEAIGNLGTLLCDLGKPDDAEIVLKKALGLNPDIIEANNSLGLALCQLGRHQEALKYLDRAILLNPSYVSAFNSKGLALSELGELNDAIEVYLAGLNIEENNSELLINLGYAYFQSFREKEAIAAIEKAIKTNERTDPEVLLRLAVMYSQIGDRKSAVSKLNLTLEIDPENAEAHRVLSTLTKHQVGDTKIDEMEVLLRKSKNNPISQMHLGFALGKAYEDIGEPAKAFQHWQTGNLNRRSQYSYSLEEDRLLFDKVQTTYTKDHFDTYQGWQNPSTQPIFVVGMMRSGTTLVEQILSSHSQVFGAGELVFIDDFARAHLRTENVFPEDLKSFSRGYLNYRAVEAKSSTRVIDKMPINFLWIGLIKTAFPKAKIINLVREPRDIGLSIFKNYFHTHGNFYAYDLEELAGFYLLYRQLMQFWHQVIPGSIYDICYESIVADLRGESEKLLEYCELDWENQVLNFQNTERVVKTASLSQVREGIYSSSVGGWKAYAKELEPFTAILEQAGYLAK